MNNHQITLPQNNWKKILPHIRLAGENGSIDPKLIGSDYPFWKTLGIFSEPNPNMLSDAGRNIFESTCIRCDGEEFEILKFLALRFPPTIALQQYLWGVANITIDQALTVLKTTGFWTYASQEPLTHFLDFLNYLNIIKYNKKARSIQILISPDTHHVPKNIYIDPARPFSNIMWIKRVLAECKNEIFWLDKHFQKEGLEWLWAVADANSIKQIKILSLDLGDSNLNVDAKKLYKRFKTEMANKGINVVWSCIDSKLIRDNHDRWIMDGANYLRNVPNVNAISSGQRSEMNYSENYSEAFSAFKDYLTKSVEVIVSADVGVT